MLLKRHIQALCAVLCVLAFLIILGMAATALVGFPSKGAEFLQDYLGYILGFAAVMYGNAAGGIIAHYYSNSVEEKKL